MPKFYVQMLVEFSGVIEADSVDDADQKAWTSWGNQLDDPITYSGIHSIDVEEVEEDDEEETDQSDT